MRLYSCTFTQIYMKLISCCHFSVIFSSIPKIYVARVQVDILKIDQRQLTVTSLGSYL